VTPLNRWPRLAGHYLISFYRVTLSSVLGRECRYLPTCSSYADEAVQKYGLWAGSWMATARLCRCHPLGGAGYDPVPKAAPEGATWRRPWRYGVWRYACVDEGPAVTTR
jgi:putative membrane protein insertion efficiency factor